MKSDFFFLFHFEQLYLISSVTIERVGVAIYNFKESRGEVANSRERTYKVKSFLAFLCLKMP